jgi:cytochrome c6
MGQLMRLVPAAIFVAIVTLTLPAFARAQSDVDKVYKTHCVLCHAPDGSGSSPSGKALKAQDLRSDSAQKKSDAELAEAISHGRGKMPAFGKKLKPEDIQQLVTFIRALAKSK